ncbi:Glucose-1-phosphate thymidylyltransferase [Planctomycetales bacterium 10988]|nr:Glucose-1-phosphate thymidylyltransferase [Planctomycetales bacterium 10988]
MNIVLFEDEQVCRLHPATIGRPAFAITCGGYRLIDLIVSWKVPCCYVVRPYLKTIVASDFPQPSSSLNLSEPLLLVNAALVPSVTTLKHLQAFAEQGKPGIIRLGTRIAAAFIPADQPPEARQLNTEAIDRYLQNLKAPVYEADLALFHYPHDIIRHHQTIMLENLEDRLKHQHYVEIASGVYAAEGATLGEYCVTDTTDGPILLDQEAKIGPYSYLTGPAYLGPKARVIEHSAIKDGVSLGHTTKIGGEVEASIIEPYTNKQHHGFLGHSYLGSWINLGAGTCNSDLKNTYGEVNMEYCGEKVATGMQFVGCIVGDYAKTAVNTSIFTGKVIGSCSMLYGFITTNVPSFTNYARSFGQATEQSPDVAIATQARMFARRKVQQRPCDIQLIHDMYRQTQHERQLANEPLSL